MGKHSEAQSTADIIVENDGKILLIKRGHEPFKGQFALPGGYMDANETIEETAVREMKEETGLDVAPKAILGVYSAPDRDPRRTVSTAFIADIVGGEAKTSEETPELRWLSPEEIDFNSLAFDHEKIIHDYIKWKNIGGTYWSSK